jgi:hypothetical protein
MLAVCTHRSLRMPGHRDPPLTRPKNAALVASDGVQNDLEVKEEIVIFGPESSAVRSMLRKVLERMGERSGSSLPCLPQCRACLAVRVRGATTINSRDR